MRHSIVIVGAGFCGTILAANLLRRPPPRPTDIALIERGPAMGRGVAYAARLIRRLSARCAEVVTCLRNLAPGIWRRLAESEQRRFVRHLQGYWDVHRHRLPPQLSARLTDLRRCGKLRINAGRIQRVLPQGNRLRVLYMETPARSSPPRLARPSTSTARAA
jgi:uncharacterized NAD(P)/FAD-binding protein YdhS